MPKGGGTLDKRDLTKKELKDFAVKLWPAKTVEDPEELRELLDCGFCSFGDDDDGEDDGDDNGYASQEDIQYSNFSAYCRKVGGFGWINAVHDFGDGAMETPLTHISRSGDDWRLLSLLLQMGADPNVRNGKGEPPLFCFMNDGSMMHRHRFWSMLMEAGANDKAVYQSKTMVQFAIMFKDNDQVSKMIYDDFDQKYSLGSTKRRSRT